MCAFWIKDLFLETGGLNQYIKVFAIWHVMLFSDGITCHQLPL